MRLRTKLLPLAVLAGTSAPSAAQVYVTRFDDDAGWTFEQCGCGPRFAVDASPSFLGPRNAAKLVDVASPPIPADQILPGSTWSFQNWDRDPSGGGTLFDFSDAVEVTFCR